jgi:N-acetyl-anhydromuramoyl-L-alanine amidase
VRQARANARRAAHSPPPLLVDADGGVNAARRIDSPNCDARPPGTAIELIVVHGISLPPGKFGGRGVIDLFTNRLDPRAHPYYATISDLRVSSHLFIRRDGELLQFVPCAMRAWHAGRSQWRERERCNDFSVGIELEGTDNTPYSSAQYSMLARVIRALKLRYPIREVLGHSEIAPGRKTDPGPAFDWARLHGLLGRTVP